MTALPELLERYPAQFRSELEKALVAELERVRNDAFDEAARICDALEQSQNARQMREAGLVAAQLAAAIRWRKGQP